MKKMVIGLAVLLLAAETRLAHAADAGVFGYWTEPGGSTIHVEKCGGDVCAVLVGIGKSTPYTEDGLNPDPALKKRPLCGLHIGTGFHAEGENKLEGGMLYDPKSGKTYKGTIESTGDSLKLRGYVGIKAFGRSETWTRSSEATATCANARRA